MSKSNREQTPEEFQYTLAMKKILHDTEQIHLEIMAAKSVGLQGLSLGALSNVEGRLYDLKAACYIALKTV